MAIESHQTLSNRLQANGRRSVRHEFVDTQGDKHYWRGRVDGAADVDAHRTAMAPNIETQLRDGEEDHIITRVKRGDSVMALVNNPKHGTVKGHTKKLIYWLMRSGKAGPDDWETARIVVALKPLIDDLQGRTNAFVNNRLDITNPQRNNFYAVADAILTQPSPTKSPMNRMNWAKDNVEAWD